MKKLRFALLLALVVTFNVLLITQADSNPDGTVTVNNPDASAWNPVTSEYEFDVDVSGALVVVERTMCLQVGVNGDYDSNPLVFACTCNSGFCLSGVEANGNWTCTVPGAAVASIPSPGFDIRVGSPLFDLSCVSDVDFSPTVTTHTGIPGNGTGPNAVSLAGFNAEQVSVSQFMMLLLVVVLGSGAAIVALQRNR